MAEVGRVVRLGRMATMIVESLAEPKDSWGWKGHGLMCHCRIESGATLQSRMVQVLRDVLAAPLMGALTRKRCVSPERLGSLPLPSCVAYYLIDG